MKIRRLIKWTFLILLASARYLPVIQPILSQKPDFKTVLLRLAGATVLFVVLLVALGFLRWVFGRMGVGKPYSSPPFDLPENAFQVRISMIRMNVFALILTAISSLAAVGAYRIIWGTTDGSPIRFLPYFIFLILLHELSHATGWILGGMPIRTIKFGVMWHQLAPYAHCSAPMSMGVFRFALLLPLLTTGFVPLGIGLRFGDIALAIASAILIGGAAGDISMFIAGISFHRHTRMMDHPSEPAFIILDKGNIPNAFATDQG